MKNHNPWIALLITLVWLALYVPACAVPRYHECRRVHPGWYCFMEQFR